MLIIFEFVRSREVSVCEIVIKREFFVVKDARPLYHFAERAQPLSSLEQRLADLQSNEQRQAELLAQQAAAEAEKLLDGAESDEEDEGTVDNDNDNDNDNESVREDSVKS